MAEYADLFNSMEESSDSFGDFNQKILKNEWKSKSGEIHNIEKMTDNHLKNTIKMFKPMVLKIIRMKFELFKRKLFFIKIK